MIRVTTETLARLREVAAGLDEDEAADLLTRATAFAAYHDDSYPERRCEHCGTLYRGPAVYCGRRCVPGWSRLRPRWWAAK
jgi:hypothetical protein